MTQCFTGVQEGIPIAKQLKAGKSMQRRIELMISHSVAVSLPRDTLTGIFT